MVVEYIRYTIRKDKQETFIAAYKKASEQLENSKFCLGFELTQCEEEPEKFILRIEWTSVNDHLNGFRNAPEFVEFLNHVRPFFNDIEEMNHYKLTDPKINKKE